MSEPIQPAHIIEAKRWDAICALLEEVMHMHADPTIAEYNECDKDPCQWCVDAKKAMDKTTRY